MRIDSHRQVVSNATAQPGPLLRPADMQARALQDLFDAQGVEVSVEYTLRIQVVARQTNTVFGTRLVGRIVTTLIEEGSPAKGFSVKGKSLNWGPQVGSTCIDQHLSKRENRDMVEIRKLNLAVAKGMDGGAYTQTDLRIPQQRPTELVRNFDLMADGAGSIRPLITQGPSGKYYEFEARQEPDSLYRVSRLGRLEAVQALASPACGLAMTADYDLFLVAPSIEAHDNSGLDARGNTAVRYIPLGAKDLLSEDGFYGREDMVRGSIIPCTRQLVDALNDCLGRGEHRRTFHHSDDAGNPGSYMGDNLPATFYLPWVMEHRLGEESIRFDEVCVVADWKNFSLLVECIKGNDYRFTAHPNWNVPLRPSFQETLDSSNVGFDVRKSSAEPAFPGGMGILPPVQGPPLAGVRWMVRGSQEWILHWQVEAGVDESSTIWISP